MTVTLLTTGVPQRELQTRTDVLLMLDLTDRIELASGKFLNLRDPDPKDLTLNDVAHGLSMTCRFSGQCSRFYSVAEHCLRVSERLEELGYDVETQLAGLLHDAAEGFVTDVPRPAKALLPDYAVLEERVLQAVLKSLGFEDLDVHGVAVKDVDNWMLAQEAHELMPSQGQFWHLGSEWDGTVKNFGRYWTPWATERLYSKKHWELIGKLIKE